MSSRDLSAWRWRKVRTLVLVRDGYRCQIRMPGCTGYATEVDHITPRSVNPGLWYSEDNCRAACRSCNNHRGVLPDDRIYRQSDPSREW